MSDTHSLAIQNAKARGYICGYCRVTGEEAALRRCVGCQKVLFCSRECQKKAWKSHHRDPCKRYQAIVTSPNVRGDDGGTTHEVISKWFGRHDAILAWGCFNAFKLRSHPERSATHIFCMVAKPRCGGAKLKPKHMLEIDLMALIPLGLVPSELKEDLDLMNADYAKRDRQDRVVTYMTVECEGYFRIRQLLWDEQELLTMREDENWKNIMWNITGVESKYRMVGSNPVAK